MVPSRGVKIFTQVCPIPPHAGGPFPSTKPRGQRQAPPPSPSEQTLLGSNGPPHSGTAKRNPAPRIVAAVGNIHPQQVGFTLEAVLIAAADSGLPLPTGSHLRASSAHAPFPLSLLTSPGWPPCSEDSPARPRPSLLTTTD